LCLFSRLLPEIDYSQLGTVLDGLGFDGCDLSVQPDGTVHPDQSPVDLVRAIESVRGVGVDLPVITTSFLNVGEPWARNCLSLSGGSGVTFFRTAYSQYPATALMQRRFEIGNLAAYGRAAHMVMGIPYPAGTAVARDLDPNWTGWDYDTAAAGSGSLADALPRVRMILLRDAKRENDQVVPCPLGEGTVDWQAFFSALAKARFAGPLTLRLDYRPQNKLQAIRKDLDFARKLLNGAYEKELAPASAPARV